VALNAYISNVQLLLHDPNAEFFTTATLTTFINQARQQIAIEGECIRGTSNVNTASSQEVYLYTAVSAPSAPTGISGLISVRSMSFNGLTLESRPWDYFNFYFRNIAKPANAIPKAWCPFQQGATFGSFYLSPIPNGIFAIEIDGVWLPIALVDDTTAEAIPYPWTDAVEFYAAYLALKDSQRTTDADHMFEMFEHYMERARGGVTPLVEADNFPGGLAARSALPAAAPANRAASAPQKA
jgi:hypothetical protein